MHGAVPEERGVAGRPGGRPAWSGTLRNGLVLFAWAAALAAVWLARHVVLLGFVAILIAVVLSFPVNWLSRLVPRGVAVVAVLLLLLGGIGGLGYVAAQTLYEQGQELAENAPRALHSARKWLTRMEKKVGVESKPGGAAPAAPAPAAEDSGAAGTVAKVAPQALGTAGTHAAVALLGVLGGITEVILVLVLAAFLVLHPAAYRRGLRRLVPPGRGADFDELWTRLERGLRGWVGGILIAMAIMGTLTAVGLLLAGIDQWLLLGIVTFLGTFVPYLGAVASAVPGIFAALAQSTQHLLWALLVYGCVHVVEGYLVEPLIMRRAVEIKPALLLFWQGMFMAVFGLLGAVVATPLLVCVQITIEFLWVERRLGRTPEGAGLPQHA